MIEDLEKSEDYYKVTRTLNGEMKAARMFGTALVVIMTKEAPLDLPLVIEEIREGDLCSLRVFDRFESITF